MLFFFSGDDRDAMRAALEELVRAHAPGACVNRITDAHSEDDIAAALRGGGLFGGPEVAFFDNVLGNSTLAKILFDGLAERQESGLVVVYERAPLAEAKKALEKRADESRVFPRVVARKEPDRVFDIADALKKKDKKLAWVALVRELRVGKAPEALHGVLFWAAKDLFQKSKEGSEARRRAEVLLLELAALPHEARRSGVELDYALEAFVLSGK